MLETDNLLSNSSVCKQQQECIYIKMTYACLRSSIIKHLKQLILHNMKYINELLHYQYFDCQEIEFSHIMELIWLCFIA